MTKKTEHYLIEQKIGKIWRLASPYHEGRAVHTTHLSKMEADATFKMYKESYPNIAFRIVHRITTVTEEVVS